MRTVPRSLSGDTGLMWARQGRNWRVTARACIWLMSDGLIGAASKRTRTSPAFGSASSTRSTAFFWLGSLLKLPGDITEQHGAMMPAVRGALTSYYVSGVAVLHVRGCERVQPFPRGEKVPLATAGKPQKGGGGPPQHTFAVYDEMMSEERPLSAFPLPPFRPGFAAAAFAGRRWGRVLRGPHATAKPALAQKVLLKNAERSEALTARRSCKKLNVSPRLSATRGCRVVTRAAAASCQQLVPK